MAKLLILVVLSVILGGCLTQTPPSDVDCQTFEAQGKGTIGVCTDLSRLPGSSLPRSEAAMRAAFGQLYAENSELYQNASVDPPDATTAATQSPNKAILERGKRFIAYSTCRSFCPQRLIRAVWYNGVWVLVVQSPGIWNQWWPWCWCWGQFCRARLLWPQAGPWWSGRCTQEYTRRRILVYYRNRCRWIWIWSYNGCCCLPREYANPSQGR